MPDRNSRRYYRRREMLSLVWWKSAVHRTLLVLMVLVSSLGILQPAVRAATCGSDVSQQDCDALINDWENWVPYSATGTCGTSGSVILTGTDNIEKAMNFFVQQEGLSAPQAAGIVGNLKAESGLNPAIQQNGSNSPTPIPNVGFGIAQWTSAGRQQGLVGLADKEGAQVNTLGVQLQYVWQELNGGYSDALNKLKQTSTASDAAIVVMIYYEAPADHSPTGTNAKIRSAAAQAILALYGSSTGSGGTVTETGSQDSAGCTTGSTDFGTGKGAFTTDTSKTYAGIQQTLARAKELSNNSSALFQQVCDGASRCYHRCDHLVAGAWGHSSSGYETAMTHWAAMKASGHGHPGSRDVPVGALLFYDTGESAGHVALYLGNNKVLSNDVNGNGGAYIVDASALETGPWRLSYLGWSDPVFG